MSEERDDDLPFEGPEEVELPIDGELDLHLFRPRDVPELVGDYLDACRERGILQVRIVHGKGIGALRETVHRVLEKRDDVERFRLDSETGSGWGATLVELSRTRPAPDTPP
ncbi:MAG TPA: Smr/MutS family protein [bacterium]|nr:Smr/MutS family protein [bacterium]